MKLHVPDATPQTSYEATLDTALHRLSQQLDAIRDTVTYLEGEANRRLRGRLPSNMAPDSELTHRSEALITELERLGKWEADQLYPILVELFPVVRNPHLMTSLWMLEKERQIMDTHFNLYVNELNQYREQPSGSCMIRAMEWLLLACRTVQQHIESEEDLLLPLGGGGWI